MVSLLGAALAVPLPAAASHGACVTSDAGLLATVAAKVERHKTTGRKDLVETFGRAYQTMLDQDTYTVSDLKARGDRRNDKWGGDGPNALWQSIYAELDRLEQCRLRHCRAKAVTPQATPPRRKTMCRASRRQSFRPMSSTARVARWRSIRRRLTIRRWVVSVPGTGSVLMV
ncbi:MAG: hypothetical protein OXF65_09580 [Acidimicrobiaceae bacterium]|nr:hypothetical protein [Acidimicrobiaceae bacterium]